MQIDFRGLGFSRENLSTNNVMIPIAYYLKHIGLPNNFESSTRYIEDRKKIKKWIVSSLLKRVFSFAPDGVLLPVRRIIKETENSSFPIERISERFETTNRKLGFSDEEIDALLWSKCGNRDTFAILSLLYPWADLNNLFHIDHIFPKSSFTEKRLSEQGIPRDEIGIFMENYNCIGNLQLLEGTPNIQKSDTAFDIWIHETFSGDTLTNYMQKNYIPEVGLNLTNFNVFITERKKLLRSTLEKILRG